MVIYLAMYTTPDRHPRLVRSADGGQTWAERDVEASLGANEFRILTVDPDDENVLYLRVIALGMESVAVTRDAGMTFAMPVTITKGTLSAFARLASGTVLVGGLLSLDSGGMNGTAYRSTDGGHTFVPWTLAPAAAHSRPRRTRGHPLRRGQELQRRLGAGHLARRRRHDRRAVHVRGRARHQAVRDGDVRRSVQVGVIASGLDQRRVHVGARDAAAAGRRRLPLRGRCR